MKTNTLFSLILAPLLLVPSYAAEQKTELKNLSVNGGLEEGKARLIIEAALSGLPSEKEKPIVATALEQSLKLTRDKLTDNLLATFNILQGEPAELTLTLTGEGEIRDVTGDTLQDWSVRQNTNGTRTLVLRPRKGEKPLTRFAVNVTAEREIKNLPTAFTPLVFTPSQPELLTGYIRMDSSPDLDVQPRDSSGLIPIEIKFLPESMRLEPKADEPEPYAFRFQGATYSLPLSLSLADPEARRVVLRDFNLTGKLDGSTAAFTLNATAVVKNPKGGSIDLLWGSAALSELEPHPDWQLRFERNRFVLSFEKSGEFPIQLKFNAAVRLNESWKSLNFHVAPAVVQPITLQGLGADTQFDFAGAARPERKGNDFVSYLPPDGSVTLSWKEARPEAEGKLFYAAEMLSQVTVSPGLMRQVALFDFKVMQGELNRVALLVRGGGDVAGVQGDQVLAWHQEPATNSRDRRLVVQFNQPQKDHFTLQVQLQSLLGAFPQTNDVTELRPEGATRFAGFVRVVNEGAVRLEVTQARALSQISPDQFPETDLTRSVLRAGGSQRFAYRFSGADYALRIQADQILPEVAVSELLAYRLDNNELTIDGEIELDIREAPLRDVVLHIPKGYTVTPPAATGLIDFNVTEPEGQPDADLRLIFGQPISGREVINVRFERNKPLEGATWTLPRIEVAKTKPPRGQIAVCAAAGWRLSPQLTPGLTEIATAYFPRKVAGIQWAYRLTDEASWQIVMGVERLPQTVQADVMHLFSIGEGIAYGSSVINYSISGAPLGTFKVELSDEFKNVDFTGKDIRNWQKVAGGYQVQLQTPVSGAYTLLATYERPFNAQGATLTFTGARPLDAPTETGHTLIISAYQFQVTPTEVSPGLTPLETGEVPPEYRLFFDAPILAAYSYAARPFNLRLALSPLAQGDSINQVVDRALFKTDVSKEGQVLTDAQFFLKNRGNPNLRLTLPAGTELWSATINGASVVPVTDAGASLIPLPQGINPNAVLALDLKLASTNKNPARVSVAAPSVGAPVLLAEWRLKPDPGQRLVYRSGSLTPVTGVTDVSGFAELARTFTGPEGTHALYWLLAGLGFVAATLVCWRWASQKGVFRFSARHLTGIFFGALALVMSGVAFYNFAELATEQKKSLPSEVTFLAPVQQPDSKLIAEVANVSEKTPALNPVSYGWPVLAAVVAWLYAWASQQTWQKRVGWVAGWTLLAWAALGAPNGALVFLAILIAFLLAQVILPALYGLGRLPLKPRPAAPGQAGAAAPAATVLLLLGMLGYALCGTARAASSPAGRGTATALQPAVAESVVQDIRVEDKFASATAKIQWRAEKGQVLPLLFQPAVLTGAVYPTNDLKLLRGAATGMRGGVSNSVAPPALQLTAEKSGVFQVELRYELQVPKRGAESGFQVPVQFGLVNRLKLTVVNADVDVLSAQAVSIQREAVGSNTVATLVLAPENNASINWRPRTRDVKSENPVYNAEVTQLYVPAAGVIEGAHLAIIKPIQGELGEIVFTVPPGATITDVMEARGRSTNVTSVVSLWRFDPDTRKLRVNISPAQSRAFALVVRSQVATGPLPFEQSVGLLSVDNAVGQSGLLGVATGNEVQLDNVTPQGLFAYNVEDFPTDTLALLQPQFPGLTVRRAFRYDDPKATASFKASAVEPDVRVQTQETVSLGEDRTVLGVRAVVAITRAGIFRLTFVMPQGFDVDSISGTALSHWTEQKGNEGRIITLHFPGKTQGQQRFDIALAGPGAKATNGWVAPQLVFREAGKQTGTLLLMPEVGLQLQVASGEGSSEGLAPLDPQQAGIKQKGVLAFNVLQTPHSLALNIEQVAPWIQVNSLQHAVVTETRLQIAANFQYVIESATLKALHVFLPTNAEGVNFQGEQVGDSLKTPGLPTNGLQGWEIRLQRRVIGNYLLHLTYQVPIPEKAAETVLRGVQVGDVSLQRGFLTLESSGRLQVRIDTVPAALQPAEWQSIPKLLQQGLSAKAANFTFRVGDPLFALPLKLERHEAVRLLAARVNSVLFNSVISDDGVMLTQARLEMYPGDKRLLRMTLPAGAKFWFAFVNESGAWPWREQDQYLIPLEQQPRGGQPIPVEIFYSCQVGAKEGRSLDLELLAPKFDLPLENLTWQVSLSDKWQVKKPKGSLQLESELVRPQPAALDLQSYLQSEAAQQQQRNRQAESLLAAANSALAQGDPQQARRAFQAAYGMSGQDAALNEDARVQLHQIKLQQALIGLSVRQTDAAGDGAALGAKFRDLRSRKEMNYTQQDAKDIIQRNSADENDAFMKLAQRLIQQQDAAVSSPATLRASIPEQSRVLTFKRAVVVDRWADLKLLLKASAARAASWSVRFLILGGILLVVALFTWAGSRRVRSW